MPCSPQRLAASLRQSFPWTVAAALLAFFALGAVLRQTGGEPSAPLDDTYIHLQFARSFAELRPFEYTPGAEPAPGATSLLWPLVLSPFLALGLDGTSLVCVAWALGFGALALLAYDSSRLAAGFEIGRLPHAAGILVLAFGGFAWFAASGMEVVPFAWVLMRTARRSAEWVERAPGVPPPFIWAALGPLCRPEGILCSALVAGALLWRPYKDRRGWATAAALGPLLPVGAYALFTGQPYGTTARAKWLVMSPYYSGSNLVGALEYNARLLFGTLLNGEVWTALFLPAGSLAFALASLAALGVAGWHRRRWARSIALLTVALGMLIPTTYETFLVNRVRYVWPFAAAWLVGLTVLAGLVGMGLGRLHPMLRWAEAIVAGAFVCLLAVKLPPSLDDLAASADAVRLQQVSLGRWARDALPEGSRIGLNDAGALAYFSGHSTFDVVGLTTAGEARYWAAGAGSRFEHYERLGPDRLPTHFIVYPKWFAIPPLLGRRLTYRTVHATILGGETMGAYEARYDALGSGARPDRAGHRAPLDELDVADLNSEAGHRYALLAARKDDNRVVQRGPRADGGRAARSTERFEMALQPGGRLILRLGTERPMRLEVRVDGRLAGELSLLPSSWQEHTIVLPSALQPGRHAVEVRGDRRFCSMHYWSYE